MRARTRARPSRSPAGIVNLGSAAAVSTPLGAIPLAFPTRPPDDGWVRRLVPGPGAWRRNGWRITMTAIPTAAQRRTLVTQLEARRRLLRAELQAKLNAQDNPALLGLQNRMQETDDWAVADLETASLRYRATPPNCAKSKRRSAAWKRTLTVHASNAAKPFRMRGSPPTHPPRVASRVRKSSRLAHCAARGSEASGCCIGFRMQGIVVAVRLPRTPSASSPLR